MRPWILILITLLALTLANDLMACPGCKDSIPSSDAPSQATLPSGFNASVYYMLVAVFTVGGLVIGMIVKEVRKG